MQDQYLNSELQSSPRSLLDRLRFLLTGTCPSLQRDYEFNSKIVATSDADARQIRDIAAKHKRDAQAKQQEINKLQDKIKGLERKQSGMQAYNKRLQSNNSKLKQNNPNYRGGL